MATKKKVESNKKEIKPAKIKTSTECEQCQHQCEAGLKYISQIQQGRAYKGVNCKF